MRFTHALALSCLLTVACKAQVNANASLNAGATAEGNAEATGSDPSSTPASSESGSQSGVPAGEPALFGARRDLVFQGTSAACRCLAVSTGQPDAFKWSGPTPSVDRKSQIVVALSSTGIPCPGAAKDARPVSYAGHTVSGSDVVVTVEDAVPGRPIVTGAIIPKPAGGKVVIAPADETTKYGRPLQGGGDRCVIP